MILEDIEGKLKEIDNKVFYGMADANVTLWNYIVFNRAPLKVGENRTGFSDRYDVHIVRENYIPEGLDIQVIRKMLEIAGMRQTSEDCQYNYARNPNTGAVVEVLSLHFAKPRKNV